MRPFSFLVRCLIVILASGACATASAQDDSLQATLDKLVEDGRLVAAHAVVGQDDRIVIDHAAGVTTPGGHQQIDDDTLFCIGSCSKPFASAIVMSLAGEGVLQLEQPISKYLPVLSNPKLADGKPVERAPTMKELLAHRAGVYSQRKRLTRQQVRWIRDFGLTLEESVAGIAGEPLISTPGSEYAYSGAGYCVAGRVAEVASGKSFEQLLQSRILVPLDLTRTTYFPDVNDMNVAAGGRGGAADPATPHLTKPTLRFPLIGGSLYSTAHETARFLRMVAARGKWSGNRVLQLDSWSIWTSRAYDNGTYGLGWSLVGPTDNSHPTTLTHAGSLASSRSLMLVKLGTRQYGVVHYTVAARNDGLRAQMRGALERAMRSSR